MKTFTLLWQYRLKTYILYSVTSFLKSCRLWGNVEECGGAREAAMTIGRLRVACWTSKTSRTQVYVHALAHLHTRARAYTQKYIILIAFQRQQSFLECVSMLRSTYISYLVEYCQVDLTKSFYVITVHSTV
jgi:hypothetical protein